MLHIIWHVNYVILLVRPKLQAQMQILTSLIHVTVNSNPPISQKNSQTQFFVLSVPGCLPEVYLRIWKILYGLKKHFEKLYLKEVRGIHKHAINLMKLNLYVSDT